MLENYQRVYAAVDLNAVRFNMESMRKRLKPGAFILAVVKTDGYGHGATPIARELEPLDYLWGFAVATAEEAMILRNSGIKKPLLILGYAFPYSYKMLVEQEIRAAVFRLDTARELSREAVKQNKKARIHLKVDTGMSRIGIRPEEEGIAFVKEVKALHGIEIEGIFTHFSKADETDKEPARAQLKRFQHFLGRLLEEGVSIPLRHCSNSAGIIELPEANLDLVRAGIALYGLWPSDQVSKDPVPLMPALSLKSQIVYVKELRPGEAVSYGGTYVADSPRRIATIPVGYGDGYPRSLSNRGWVLIRGKRAPIRGRVCMDQFMADVTDIPEAEPGDQVTLIGTDGPEQISAELLGELSGRFNYELMCDLGKRIPRVYIKDKKVVGHKDYFQDWK